MATYQMGVVSCVGTGADAYGLLQSTNTEEMGDLAEARDADGDVVAVTPYNRQIDQTTEVVFDTAKTLPEFGATVDMKIGDSTTKGMVQTVSRAEENQGYARATITAKRWAAGDFPSAT